MEEVALKLLALPRLGETMEEGELMAWLKQPGETVRRGEVVAEIGTDKIVAEMPALEDFVLEEHLVPPGQTVKVGQPIARVRPLGASKPVENPPLGPEPDRQAASSLAVPKPPSSPLPAAPKPVPDRPKASPAARHLARQLGLDLRQIVGTGPHGRITTEDVKKTAEATAQGPAPTARIADPGQFLPFSRIQAAAARATHQSKQEIPHFYVRARADLTAFVRTLETERSRGLHLTLNDLLIKAVALALRKHPRLNAVVREGGLELLPQIHIGVLTATPEGLVTSVVRDADTLSPAQISSRVREIRARASVGRARSEDVQGATFCLSNLGMFGVEEFSAIILPPNVAILAIGAVQEEVVAENAAIRIAKTLRLTVSADHRALDGVEVALFLQTLKGLLEHPASLYTGPDSAGSAP
ncbi:MAG: 2-oxo acid dehydrogenase subunit E2 [Thermaceae bacterium]|nr:2-oxo acid dehydrogenase subunit E2 [Thermaceae bacterium]